MTGVFKKIHIKKLTSKTSFNKCPSMSYPVRINNSYISKLYIPNVEDKSPLNKVLRTRLYLS